MTPARFIEWREALGGRRFLMALGAGFVNTALRIFEYLDIPSYVTLTLGIIGVYIGGRALPEVANVFNKSVGDSDSGNSTARGDGARRKIGVGPSDSEAG